VNAVVEREKERRRKKWGRKKRLFQKCTLSAISAALWAGSVSFGRALG